MGFLFGDNFFIAYAWSDPDGRQACVLFLAACVAALAVLAIGISAWRAASERIEDLEEQLLPLHSFAFSAQGEVEVYEEGVRVLRSGICVSPMLHDVWSAEAGGPPGDRVLSVRWMNGRSGPETTDIHLGPVDGTSLDKLRDIMEHYGKG